jgi:hypothetical protein
LHRRLADGDVARFVADFEAEEETLGDLLQQPPSVLAVIVDVGATVDQGPSGLFA